MKLFSIIIIIISFILCLHSNSPVRSIPEHGSIIEHYIVCTPIIILHYVLILTVPIIIHVRAIIVKHHIEIAIDISHGPRYKLCNYRLFLYNYYYYN